MYLLVTIKTFWFCFVFQAFKPYSPFGFQQFRSLSCVTKSLYSCQLICKQFPLVSWSPPLRCMWWWTSFWLNTLWYFIRNIDSKLSTYTRLPRSRIIIPLTELKMFIFRVLYLSLIFICLFSINPKACPTSISHEIKARCQHAGCYEGSRIFVDLLEVRIG